MKNLQKSRIIFFSLMTFLGLGSHVLAQSSSPKIPEAPILPDTSESPRSLLEYKNPESCSHDDAQCVADFIKRLESPNHLMRRGTAWQLGLMKQKATKAVPALIKMLQNDPGKWERIHAAIALRSINIPISKILFALRVALNDSDKDVANTAATYIGEIAANLHKETNITPLSLSEPLFESLSESERKIVISELKASLRVLQNPRRKFATEPINRVTASLSLISKAPKIKS